MISRLLTYCLVVGFGIALVTAEICTEDLIVDNFERFDRRHNTLGLKTSDDGTMTSIRRVGDRVWFVPQRTSYFYETLPCIDAATSGYTAVAFSIRAPKDASITLEVQTMDNCAASTYNSTYRSVGGFAGRPQRLKIPLDTFQGANMNAVFAFTWSTFDFYSDKNFMWQLADVELVCNCTGHRVAGVEQVCTA